MMMPGVDPKVIYRVNRAMDNPDPWSIYLNEYMKKPGHGNAFDVPGLRGFLLLYSEMIRSKIRETDEPKGIMLIILKGLHESTFKGQQAVIEEH